MHVISRSKNINYQKIPIDKNKKTTFECSQKQQEKRQTFG